MKSGVVRVAFVVIGGLLFAGSGFAKKAKDDPLDRMTLVPVDQPIPIIDFFRPPVFISPELNPAGTHFAALVSAGADRASGQASFTGIRPSRARTPSDTCRTRQVNWHMPSSPKAGVPLSFALPGGLGTLPG